MLKIQKTQNKKKARENGLLPDDESVDDDEDPQTHTKEY